MAKKMEINQCLECKYYYDGECRHIEVIKDYGEGRPIGPVFEIYRGLLASFCPFPEYD